MTEKVATGLVVVDLERCLACRSCETACAKAHAGFDDIVEAILAGAELIPRVHVVAAGGKAVPIQCQHCEDAPCVEVCLTGGLHRDEEGGPVRADPDKCIGCKACAIVCPFGSIQWSRGQAAMVKCDLCEDIIEEGEVPRCVAACPTGARRVVSVDDLARDRRQEAARRTIMVAHFEVEAPGA